MSAVLNETEERRLQKRPHPPKPGVKMQLLLWADAISTRLFSNLKVALIILLVLLLSSSLMIWSLYFRLPDIQQTLQGLQQQTQLQDQLIELKNQWTEEELASISQRLNREQSRVFEHFPALSAWLRERYRYAGAVKSGHEISAKTSITN